MAKLGFHQDFPELIWRRSGVRGREAGDSNQDSCSANLPELAGAPYKLLTNN